MLPELSAKTNFTFLTGASHPEELMTRAAELGLSAVTITDRNSLAGVVRAWSALKELKRESEEAIKIRSQHRVDASSRQEIPPDQTLTKPEITQLPRLIVGCRLVLRDSSVHWIALPRDRAAYERLCRLLTLGKRRAEKGECHLDLQDLLSGCKGMILIALPQGSMRDAISHIQPMRRQYPNHVFLGAAPRYDGSDQAWLTRCAQAALKTSAPMVAVGDVLMHRANRRQLADVLRQERDLHLRRSRVTIGDGVLVDQFLASLCGYRHRDRFSLESLNGYETQPHAPRTRNPRKSATAKALRLGISQVLILNW